ncbi:MAG: hypothetical protein CV087_08760 [Candidatus Brocadia sp. WS118]|nr:MAG: hypothetical protein CV087_08760 [Candidatus Brocadia sp. WS118]
MTDETIINLDSIFNDNISNEAQPEIVDVETEENTGENIKNDEPPSSEEDVNQDEVEKKGHVPVKAVTEERRKRQAAEKAAEEARAELEAYRNQSNRDVAQRPDASEDPEGALKYTETVLERRLIDMQINASRNIMLASKQVFPDYEEKEKVFVSMAKNNPILIAEMRDNENPALFAYNKAKEHLDYQEFLNNKNSTEYQEFLEFKKANNKPSEETPEEKRKKSALSMPNLINSSSSKISQKQAQMPTLDDLFP